MTTLIIILITVISIVVLLQITMYIKMKRAKGKSVNPELLPTEIKNKITNENLLIYFFSPNCTACKIQSPVIEELKREFKNVFSIDISKYLNVARDFGIMATPASVIVQKGIIKDVLVGVKNKEVLINYLNNK